MNPSDYRICLDVQAPHGAVELDAKQGDSERRIFITLTDGGVPYGITEDCRPLLTAKKPDGTVLYNLCSVAQNTAIYTLTRQTTACPGRVRCELRLYGSSFELDEEGKPSADSAQLLTAATFTLLVHSQVCSDEDAIASLPESTQLEQLVTDTQALLTHVQTKLEQGDFVGEKGDTGEKGEKGEKGDKGDPGQVNINDDTIEEDSTWSSAQISAEISDCVNYSTQNKADSQKAQARKNMGACSFVEVVDKLCPSFTESGAVVSCEPVEGYPLTVTAEEGATITRCGQNLFDYKKWVAFAKAANNNSSYARENVPYLERECFSYPLYRRDTTVFFTDIQFKPNTQYTFKMQVAATPDLDQATNIVKTMAIIYEDGSQSSYLETRLYADRFVEVAITSQAGKTIKHLAITRHSVSSAVAYVPIDSCVIMEGTTAEYAPYTGETFAQGEQIQALSGVNTLWADSGLLTVSGKADPVAELHKLKIAILSLGGNL